MNPRVVLLPLAVLFVAGGITIVARGRTPGPGPAVPPSDPDHGDAPAGGIPKGPWHIQRVHTHLAPTTEKIPCRVRAPKPVSLLPPLAATPVDVIHVREGQAVRRGDLLVTFSGAQWERALAAAEKAGDPGAVAEAKKALASLEVRATEDGIVYSMAARRGERPLESRSGPLPVVVLFDWRRLSYEATAPASLAEILKATPQVFVRGGKDSLVEAEIVVNGPAAADGTLPLVLRPKAAPTAVPEPDGEGEIAVMVGTHLAPIVPTTSVRQEGGRSVVYVVTLTGDLVPRTVTLGAPAEDGFIEVSGVTKEESVAAWE